MAFRDGTMLAKQTLAKHWQCEAAVFDMPENTFLLSSTTFFEVVTFGQGAVFRTSPAMHGFCRATFQETKARWIMDSENLFLIETQLRLHDKKLCGEHVRYIYAESGRMVNRPDGFTYTLYEGDAVKDTLYAHKGFDNALNYLNDVIAIAAWDGDTLAALAAADNGMHPLWQIGIDTMPAYRKRGLAAYLVKALSEAIVARGFVPYYTTWSANIASTHVALRCGYLPCWVGYMAE